MLTIFQELTSNRKFYMVAMCAGALFGLSTASLAAGFIGPAHWLDVMQTAAILVASYCGINAGQKVGLASRTGSPEPEKGTSS